MISMEPVLKRGYASWDRDLLPADEYAARIDTLRAALREARLDALVVVNYSLLGALFEYADIAYLAGLQAGGVLLVTPAAPPVLASFGGGRELPFMRTQTWIGDVRPGAGRPFEVIAAALGEAGITSGTLAIVGMHAMPATAEQRLTAALSAYTLHAFDAELAALRAVKRPRELAAMRIAQGIVDDALSAALAAFAEGCDNAAAMLAAERVARSHKARDVRVLASMGDAALRPFEGRHAGRHAPLRLWVAAQYQGYWAQAAGTSPHAPAALAERAVTAMRAAVRVGGRAGVVAAAGLGVLPAALKPAACDYGLGGTTGLALEEGIAIEPGNETPLVAGSVLALRCVVADANAPSIACASVRVTESGPVALRPASG